MVCFHGWRAGSNSLLFFFFPNLIVYLSSHEALGSSCLQTNLIFFLQLLPASFLKCLREEMTPKTTSVPTSSAPQRKPTTYRPKGPTPHPFGGNHLQAERQGEFYCAYALDSISDANVRSSVSGVIKIWSTGMILKGREK